MRRYERRPGSSPGTGESYRRINQPRPEERAFARVSKDGNKRDRESGHPSRRRFAPPQDEVCGFKLNAPDPIGLMDSIDQASVSPAVSPHLLADGAGDARFAQLHRRCGKITRAAGDLQHKLGAGRLLELVALTD